MSRIFFSPLCRKGRIQKASASIALVVDGQVGGALAEGGHVLVMGRVRSSGSRAIAGGAADGDVGNLCCEVHNVFVL